MAPGRWLAAAAALALLGCGHGRAAQSDGALQATLLGEGGVFAGLDTDVHFFLAARDRPGAMFRLVPLDRAAVTAEVTMPSMPGMAPMTPTVHDEGAPGYYGLSAVFPHGGAYHIHLTVREQGAAPRSAAFAVEVQDLPENAPLPPPPFTAEVRSEPAVVQAGKPAQLTFTVHQRDNPATWKDFVVVHTKPWHLMVMSKDLRWFDHIHPQPQADGTYTVTETFPAGGEYLLLSDVSPRGFGQQFLPLPLTVSGEPFATPYRLAPSPATTRAGGLDVHMDAPSPLKPHEDITLAFSLKTPDGTPVTDLEPYLGAMGHLILVNEARDRFVHSHPVRADASPDGSVRFLARFPSPGLYKAWAQFQRAGQVITADFVVKVTGGGGTAGGESPAS
jgi:hypothetical protein